MRHNISKTALVKILAIVSTLCTIAVFFIGTISGFTRLIIVLALMTFACCASVWYVFFIMKDNKQ